jgi:hypothetical protein
VISRRGLLGGILSACVAPTIVHNPMRLWVPRQTVVGMHFGADDRVIVLSPSMAEVWSNVLGSKFLAATVFGESVARLYPGEIGRIDDGFKIVVQDRLPA